MTKKRQSSKRKTKLPKPKVRAKKKITGGTNLPAGKGQLGLKLEFPAIVTSVALDFAKGVVAYEDMRQTLFKVVQVRDAANWWTGDILNAAEAKHGEKYTQMADETGLSPDTLMILSHVARRVDPITRRKELSWSHHREVAKFEAHEQAKWLQKAIEKGWSVADLKEAIKKAGGKDKDDEPKGEEEGEKCCDCCGAGKPGMKVCGKCGSVASAAIGLGTANALELLKAKPTKPQAELLSWAFEQIKEPEHFTDDGEKVWNMHYARLKKAVGKKAA